MHVPDTHGPPMHGPDIHGRAMHDRATHDPATLGPAMYVPATHGPAMHVPDTHGPATRGPVTHYPATHCPATRDTYRLCSLHSGSPTQCGVACFPQKKHRGVFVALSSLKLDTGFWRHDYLIWPRLRKRIIRIAQAFLQKKQQQV